MATNEWTASASNIANLDIQKFLHEGLPYNSKDDGELQNALKVSSEVDMTLAYSSDKLANVGNLLLHVLAMEKDIVTIDIEDDEISAELIEKAFTFDLLSAILNFELRELDNLMCDLQDLIVDSIHKISSSGQSVDLVSGMVSKLHDSEEAVKQSQERLLEMKIQLAKLQITSNSVKPNGWKSDVILGAKEEFQPSIVEWKPQIQTVEQSHIFRMLEKSIMGGQELEKELTKFKQNEEVLNLKMQLIEQVAVCMEETAEVAWVRFLEADNAAEVLMGISKEMLGKLQILQLNLSSSIKREEETKSKLQKCLNQLNSKEVSIRRLDSEVSILVADSAEVTHLRERVQLLEGKLNETESRLKEADLSNEMSRQKLKEMEDEIESLKESIYDSETRAGRAEEKIAHLTDSNLEHSEELEILIDGLKQKVTKAESKTESMEGQCIELSEKNSELNKERDFLRSRNKSMETSSNQKNVEKKARAKEIKVKANLMMDTVMQLAKEREDIQKKLISLTEENKALRTNKRKDQKHESLKTKSCNDEGLLSLLGLVDAEPSISSVIASEISSNKFQMKALDFEKPGGPNLLRIKEVPMPPIESYDILIQVAAAGFNLYDTWQRQRFLSCPYVLSSYLGYECSGKVVGIGSSVRNFKLGDEVCAILEIGGGCAEFVVLPKFHVLRIPSGVSLAEAATLPQASFVTLYALSKLTNITPSKIIMIHGEAGGIGIIAIQYAKYVGCEVIAVEGTEEKLQLCKVLGADVCINYKKEDLCKRVKAETGEKGVDIIVDASGRDHFHKNVDCLAIGGSLIILGSGSASRVDIDLSVLMQKDINIIGGDLRHIRRSDIESLQSDVEEKIWPLIEAGHIKPIIGKTFSFSEATKAYKALKDHSIAGKILVVPQ